MNPPLPSEISAFEPPSPSEFPVTFRGGGGVWIFLEPHNQMRESNLLSFQQIRRIICLAAMLEGIHRGLLKLHVSSLNTIPFSEVKICQ